ncbi:MAG: hypothetical protein KBH15_01005 [Candidatus Atribacteria bacterium]|nr:hypothetical protein [Candidatus Atribacteria bacterium]
MKKGEIIFCWLVIFLLLLGGEALAQGEIYLSVPAHIYPGEMIKVNISGQEIKGAQCSLYLIKDPEEYIQNVKKESFFQVDSWQPNRPLEKEEEWQNTKYSFFQAVRKLASRVLPASVKKFLRELFDIQGPLPRRPIAITSSDFRRGTDELKTFWVDLPPEQDSTFFWKEVEINPLPPGVYLFTAQGGEKEARVIFSVTHLSCLSRQDEKKGVILVQDLKTGIPQQGVQVKIWQGKEKEEGFTDSEGLYSWEKKWKEEEEAVILVEKDKEFAFLNFYPYYWEEGNLKAFIYSERPLYKPGQTVLGKAILREANTDKYVVPPRGEKVEVALVDYRDNEYGKTELSSNSEGSVNFSFSLPPKIEEGDFLIRMRWRDREFYQLISIENYEKPSFTVRLTPEKPVYAKGEEVCFSVKGEYYSQRPLEGGEFRYQVFRYPIGYWEEEREEEIWREGTGVLNEKGEGEIRFLPEGDGAFRYQVRCIVFDPAYRAVEKREEVRVLMGEFYLSLRPQAYFVKVGETMAYGVEARNAEEEKVAVDKVYGEVYRLEWEKEKEKWREIPSQFLSASLSSGAGEIRIIPDQSGYYRLEVYTQDKSGNKILASSYFWVTGEDLYYPSQDLEVRWDKESYRVGEKARVLIIPPREGTFTFLFSIEGSNLQEAEVKQISAPEEIILPVLPSYVMGAYVSFSGFSDGKLYSESLPIPLQKERELQIKITPSKDKYQPEEKGKISIQVSDAQGKPVKCELSLAMVDQAIFDLSSWWRENIYDYFYSQFYNLVYSSYSVYSSFYSRGIPFQDMKAQFKGDGGAGVDVGGEVLLRKYFPDTLFWEPTLTTNEEGKVEVDFVAPHSLTRWQVEVKAHQGELFGEAKGCFTTYQPFALGVELPSFLAEGDTLKSKITLWNELAPQEVVIEGESSPEISLQWEKEPRKVSAPEEVSFPLLINAQSPGKGYLRLFARGEKAQDAIELPLEVKEKGVEVEKNFSSFLEEKKTSFDFSCDSYSTVELTLFSNSQSVLLEEIEYMLSYPYRCSEQVASRLITFSSLPLGKTEDKILEVIEAIREDIYALYNLQSYDGGWGFWGEEGDLFHTAYALLALHQAKNRGFLVSDEAIERGLRFLEENIIDNEVYLNPPPSDFDKALSWYVLSLERKDFVSPSLPSLRELDDKSLALWGLVVRGENRDKVEKELEERAHALGDTMFWGTVNPQKPWEDDRFPATTFAALFLKERGNPLGEKAYLWLWRNKKGGDFFTTLKRAYFLLVSSQFLNEESNVSNFRVFCNGMLVKEGKGEEKITIPGQFLQEGSNRLDVEGDNLFMAELQVKSWKKEAPPSQFFLVKKNYYLLVPTKGEEVFFSPQKVDVFHPQEEIVCEIEIQSPDYLEYLVIEDGMPAGCELIRKDYTFSLPEEEGHYPLVVKTLFEEQPTLFVYDLLPGKNVIRYYLRVRDRGNFYVKPSLLYLMYFPEVRDYGEEKNLVVE